VSTPSPSEVRRTVDEISRALGPVLNHFVGVHDWAHSKDRGQAGAEADAKGEGKTLTPSRRPAWEQDSTGELVLNKAKARARGNARRAAEQIGRAHV